MKNHVADQEIEFDFVRNNRFQSHMAAQQPYRKRGS